MVERQAGLLKPDVRGGGQANAFQHLTPLLVLLCLLAHAAAQMIGPAGWAARHPSPSIHPESGPRCAGPRFGESPSPHEALLQRQCAPTLLSVLP